MKPDDGFKLSRESEAPHQSERPRSFLGRAFTAIYENDILFVIAIVIAVIIFVSL